MQGASEKVKHQLGGRLWNYDFPLIEAEYVQPEKYCTDLREFFQTMQKMLQAGLEESLIMRILNCTKEEIVLAAAGR